MKNQASKDSEHDIPFGVGEQRIDGPNFSAPAAVGTRIRVSERTKDMTKGQRPHVVIIHNDDEHTPRFVVAVLMEVCKMTEHQAVQTTIKIHHEGEAVVWQGLVEHCELKREQIATFGKDDLAIMAGAPAIPLNVIVREG